MSTPVINAIDNVNDATLNNLFQAVANNATARESLSQSNRNIDAVASNPPALRGLGDNAGQDEAIRLCLCRRSGRDPANFPNTATDIVQNGTFRGEIFGDAVLSSLLSASQPGMGEVASSATFSGELAGSQTAMPVMAASRTAMAVLTASQTAMQQVAASQTATQEVAASQTAMQEVVASQTALEEVAASQTAANAVASSGTALSEIEAASSSADNSVPGPNNAPIYIAELSGGGGGGAGGNEGLDGTDGQDTTFHESTAEGGDRGRASGENGADEPSGNGFSAPPDIELNAIEGGGAAGGFGNNGSNGGDGGFLKALIINPERDSLSLGVGSGGLGRNFGSDGDDGSATIFTPNVF